MVHNDVSLTTHGGSSCASDVTRGPGQVLGRKGSVSYKGAGVNQVDPVLEETLIINPICVTEQINCVKQVALLSRGLWVKGEEFICMYAWVRVCTSCLGFSALG